MPKTHSAANKPKLETSTKALITTPKCGAESSKVGTIEHLTKHLSADEAEKVRLLMADLDRCWKFHSKGLAAVADAIDQLGSNRRELGRLLVAVRAALVQPGRNGRFSRFLRHRKIPKETAYSIMGDYERSAALPAPILEAAKRVGIDPATKRYLPFLEDLASIEGLTADKAVKAITEQKSKPKKTSQYSDDELRMLQIFSAMEKALKDKGRAEKRKLLSSVLNAVAHFVLQEKEPYPIHVVPSDVDDWLLLPSRGKAQLAELKEAK
jgi:hypothetical protein